MLKSVEAEWTGFAAMVFRNMDISDTQRREMRKAFFAGAWALFNMVEEIGEPGISEQEGVDHLEAIRSEILEFKSTMMKTYTEGN